MPTRIAFRHLLLLYSMVCLNYSGILLKFIYRLFILRICRMCLYKYVRYMSLRYYMCQMRKN